LFWAIFVLAAVFALLTLVRVGGAERALIRRKWPSLGLGLVAVFLAWRGLWGPALVVAGLSGLAWIWPWGKAAPPVPDEAADVEARRLLGVGADASPGVIRAAYRNKMRTAHPDQGGTHAQAARLAAARDRLLRKRR
jgi:hypothetical protein